MDEKNNIVEQLGDAIPAVVKPKKLTIKKIFLYIITLYFVIIILKYLAIFVWKCLGLLRKYIHDITDEHKFIEVILWTAIGVVIGVVLHKQIMYGIEWLIKHWQEVSPFVKIN